MLRLAIRGRSSMAMVSDTAVFRVARRSIVDELKCQILAKQQADAPRIAKLQRLFTNGKVSGIAVNAVYGGMRGIAPVHDPSPLDAHEGIRFRGLTIPECQEKLPKGVDGTEPLPEAMFWLLLTGNVPTADQVARLNAELQARVDPDVINLARKAIEGLPATAHPMTQFRSGMLALRTASKFRAACAAGEATKKDWELVLEDSLDCVARSPQVAAMIYRRLTTGKTDLAAGLDKNLDWGANFANQLGFTDAKFWDYLRLYLTIHVGGSVSADITENWGDPSDPYSTFGVHLHSLPNQEVLTYLLDMREKCKEAGVNITDRAALEKFMWDLLSAQRVGYGHAALRKSDLSCQRDFASRNFPNDELLLFLDAVCSVMPEILAKHGRTMDCFPNVNAHSGVLLQHFGLTQQDYYTVLHGVSRQLGVLSCLVWDCLEGRPVDRPESDASLLRSITHLDLSDHHWMNDEDIRSLGEMPNQQDAEGLYASMQRLQRVNLRGCKNVTKAGILALPLPQRQRELLMRWDHRWTLDSLAASGDVEAMEQLIEFGASVDPFPWGCAMMDNTPGGTPLHTACRRGHHDAVRLLVRYGANVYAVSQGGDTPLAAACRSGRVDIVKLLIGLGANPDVRSIDVLSQRIQESPELPMERVSETPLQAACSSRSDIVALLLSYGADANISGAGGRTPLREAATWRNAHSASLLVKHGALVDARSKDGATPMSEACRNDDTEIVRLLASSGANVKPPYNLLCFSLWGRQFCKTADQPRGGREHGECNRVALAHRVLPWVPSDM